MYEVILIKWHSLVVSIGSIIYGLQLTLQPSILENYKVYGLIREMFNHRWIGSVFITLGILMLIGIVLDRYLIKKLALRGLLFLWLLFMVAFIITPPPNTVWVLAFTMFCLGLGIVLREE